MSSGYIGFSEKYFGLSDALAIYLLQSLKEFSKYEVVRVVTDEHMQQCDVLVGVGEVFSPEELRFSHYGEDFNESMSSLRILKSYKERLSTAGLVFAVYGKDILKQMNPEIYYSEEGNGPAYPVDFKHNYRRIYEYFIEVLDCFTWSEPLDYSTPEKEKLMEYFSKTSNELETALSARRTDFASIVDIYSGRMGNKFRETLQWFYTYYLPSYHSLKTAFDEATLVDMSGQIVVCDQYLANITIQDLVERITSNLTVTPLKVLPKIMVIRSKDKYRVECLKYTKLDKNIQFPSAGVEIRTVKDLGYFSDDKTFAIMKTLDSAILMAKALLLDIENISKKKQEGNNQLHHQSASPPSCSSATSTTNLTSRAPITPVLAQTQSKPSETLTKTSKNKVMDATNTNSSEVKVQYLCYPLESSEELHTYDFQVFGHSAHPSTEKLIDVDSLESHPSSVSVTMKPSQASVSSLTKQLRDKYPVYSNYNLAFKDINGRLMELMANSTTESADFWARVQDSDFYFADLEAERSLSSSPTNTYETRSGFEQCSPRLAPLNLDCEIEEQAVGIELDRWDLPELLATAILLLSNRCELHIANITSPNCVVRLGPGPNSYEDPMHRYTSKNHITMHQLAFLNCKSRLSCCGIAFGIHGLASIEQILRAKFPDTTQKRHIFRRLYGRLIGAVDAAVNGVEGGTGGAFAPPSNGLSLHSFLATKEAQTLDRIVRNCLPKNGGNELARNEADKLSQFLTALHFTQRYYTKFVNCLYNELNS